MVLPERFAACIMLIAIDNGFTARRPEYWPGFLDYDWIEKKLKVLSEAEIETFCTGGDAEQKELIIKHDLAIISGLLAMILDGDFHHHFYLIPGINL